MDVLIKSLHKPTYHLRIRLGRPTPSLEQGSALKARDKTLSHHVDGAPQVGSHDPSHGPSCRASGRAEAAVSCMQVAPSLRQPIGAQPNAIHQELIQEGRGQALLQGSQAVHLADGEESMEDISVVPLVGAGGLQLSLQLHSSLHHFQGVCKYTSPTSCQATHQEVHGR